MRRLIAIVSLAGGVVAAIWLGLDTDTANRVATCPVQLSSEGLRLAADAGLSLKRNELLRFPVVRTALADGGLRFDLPPNMDDLRGLVKVKDWTDCAIDATATFPGVAARWDAGLPFVFPGAAARRCVRAKQDAGLPCLLVDGGTIGDRNTYAVGLTANPATCERVECSITFRDDPEVDL